MFKNTKIKRIKKLDLVNNLIEFDSLMSLLQDTKIDNLILNVSNVLKITSNINFKNVNKLTLEVNKRSEIVELQKKIRNRQFVDIESVHLFTNNYFYREVIDVADKKGFDSKFTFNQYEIKCCEPIFEMRFCP
jgi:Leucine-rich repeat (LRR) protein